MRILDSKNQEDIEISLSSPKIYEYLTNEAKKHYEDIKRSLNILEIDFEGKTVRYERMEITDLQPAYAISVHKSQGSEYPVVIFPLLKQHFMMLQRNLVYTGLTRAKKKVLISFSMNRFYQGDWIDSMASRFIDELPEKYIEKNSFFDEEVNTVDDFDFNQDFEIEEETKSPGWIRYQKRIK